MSDAWDGDILGRVAEALRRAESGRPTVLQIDGVAGMGKSTLLNELAKQAAAADFEVLEAEAMQGDSTPYGSLTGWGFQAERTLGGGFPPPFVVAQQVRILLDTFGRRPILLMLDDLQWSDPESIQTITVLMQRASGDRLLLAVASRPDDRPDLPWYRWIDRSPAVLRIALQGLSREQSDELIRKQHPNLPVPTMRALYDHTHGNPLYLTSITRERGAEVLTRSRILPAPAQFALTVGRTLAGLDDSKVRLMRAISVLGLSWGGLAEAAEVADIDDPDPAAQALADASLLQIREVDGAIEVRPAHDLIRSAVYEQIPLAERRVLHLAASRRADLPVETALEHRLSAAPRYDAALADELADYGWNSYRRRLYRRAAQFLRWASSVTASAPLRERRWLDSLYVSVMARDYALVRAELNAVREAGDTLRGQLVTGALEVMEGNWLIAVNILRAALEPVAATRESADPERDLVVYRIEVLLAWALSGTGGSTSEVLAGLRRAAEMSVRDDALDLFFGYTQGPAQVRLTGPVAALDALHFLAADPADVPPEQRYALGWRGLLLNTIGSFEDAITNQRAMQRSVQAGQSDDASSGGIHAFAAFSHWMLGQWDLATLNFRLAMETPNEFVLPVVLAYLPVDPAGRGDFGEADRRLAHAEQVIDDLRWPEAIQNLLMAQVVRHHASSTPAQKADLLPSMRLRWGAAIAPSGLVGPTWLMHAAIAAVWAGDWHFATRLIGQMRSFDRKPAWVEPISGWLSALVADGAGDLSAAIRILRSTPDAAARSVPLYRAHMAADLASFEQRDGNADRALHAMSVAKDLYSRIGALNYVSRLESDFSGQDPTSNSRASVVENSIASISRTYDINDRERDVLTLVADGLSYLQISSDLFITRSTVAYHMSKIYAKTGTANRHELVGLLRNR